MAFKREVQKVSIGEVKGAKDSLVLTLQITAEDRPLSVRERQGLINSVRNYVRDAEGLTLGYHTAKKAAQAKVSKKRTAKKSESGPSETPSSDDTM